MGTLNPQNQYQLTLVGVPQVRPTDDFRRLDVIKLLRVEVGSLAAAVKAYEAVEQGGKVIVQVATGAYIDEIAAKFTATGCTLDVVEVSRPILASAAQTLKPATKMGSDAKHLRYCERLAKLFVDGVQDRVGAAASLLGRDVLVALVMEKVVGCIYTQENEDLPVWRMQDLILAAHAACNRQWPEK